MTGILKRNNVNVVGIGKEILLFAHGFGGDQNSWRYITPAFSAEYKLILFDYVGAGKSDITLYDSKKYSSLDGYATDIIERDM